MGYSSKSKSIASFLLLLIVVSTRTTTRRPRLFDLSSSCCVCFVEGFTSSLPLLHHRSTTTTAYRSSSSFSFSSSSSSSSSISSETLETKTQNKNNNNKLFLSYNDIQVLSYRELQKECTKRTLSSIGTTAELRSRLLLKEEEKSGSNNKTPTVVQHVSEEDYCNTDTDNNNNWISFCDESDPTYEFNYLMKEIKEKSSLGHWKSAVRKLKKLSKLSSSSSSSEFIIPYELYISVLRCCTSNRLHGARASEPARKILEDMSSMPNYIIPSDLANSCIVHSCLGSGIGGTHDGYGGVDTALAMLHAIQKQQQQQQQQGSSGGSTILTADTYSTIVSALSKDGSYIEAHSLLRQMIVDYSFTPSLETFADVAECAIIAQQTKNDALTTTSTTTTEPTGDEIVLQILALTKASGYALDSIASIESGRRLLASGIIAAERLNNLALGLRLLTAAAASSKSDDDRGRGDLIIATSSSYVQKACIKLHKRAIDQSIQDKNWKLATKLLQLMSERSLLSSSSSSANIYRKVVTICAKCEKSKKATSILLDWVEQAKAGTIDKPPPLSVFNTVVNVCEICGEEELTLRVLESMKQTHNTDGNIITFNIALKRLAKLGNIHAIEGILIGMLQASIEPNVISYTTTIGACAYHKNSMLAYEWLRRMRSRNIKPNGITYNTALASCLDGTLDSTIRASVMIEEWFQDLKTYSSQINTNTNTTTTNNNNTNNNNNKKGSMNEYLPNTYSKSLALSLMKQLRTHWRNGDIDMKVAKTTIRVPFLKIVDFERISSSQKEEKENENGNDNDNEKVLLEQQEKEIEYESLHKFGRRMVEV